MLNKCLWDEFRKEAAIRSISQTWTLRFREAICPRLHSNQEAETGFEPRSHQLIKPQLVPLYIQVYSNRTE